MFDLDYIKNAAKIIEDFKSNGVHLDIHTNRYNNLIIEVLLTPFFPDLRYRHANTIVTTFNMGSEESKFHILTTIEDAITAGKLAYQQYDQLPKTGWIEWLYEN